MRIGELRSGPVPLRGRCATTRRAGNATGDACPDSVAVLRRKLAEIDGCLVRMTDIRSRLREQLDNALRDETCPTQTCS